VRDSDRIIGVLNSRTKYAEQGLEVKKHLLITRYAHARAQRGEMLSIEDVQEILAIPLLGVIPESTSVLHASNQGVPVTLGAPSDAKNAYKNAISRLLGQTTDTTSEKGWRKILGGLRLFNRSTA
jgi:septum site-determining protein MinD